MATSSSAPGEAATSQPSHLVSVSFVLVLLVLGACFWPFAEGRHFLYGDLGNWALPMRMFYADSLQAGDSPLWSPHLFSGFYLHGEGQVGMFHPVHWLVYRWLPFGLAFAIECTLPYPLAFGGMFLFLRRLPVAPAAALCGAAAFGFSTYLLVRYTHLNVPTIIAHVPWLLWLAGVASAAPARARCFAWIGIALLTASQVLLGYPGAVVFSVAYLGLYLLFLSAEEQSLRPLLGCAAATALGLLIGAVQLLPTLELFEMSERAGASLSARTVQSLHPWNLLQLLSPYLFAQRVYQIGVPNPIEQSFYLGAAMPIAVAWLIARRERLARHRRLLICLGVSCGVSLLIAMGQHAGVYDLIAAIPFIGQLRVPARYTLIFHFAGAIVLALAFADLLPTDGDTQKQRVRASRWIWCVPAASIVIAIAALGFAGGEAAPAEPGRRIASFSYLLVGPALSLVCAAIWYAAARGLHVALAGLVFFVAADQAAYGASLWWSVPAQTLAEFKASAPRVPEPDAGRVAMGFSDRIQVDKAGNILFYTSTRTVMHDSRLVWGYASLMPERALPPYSPKALEIAGTAYLLKQGRFVRVADPLPRFRLVSDVRRTSELGQDIEQIDVASTALVEEDVAIAPGPSGTVRVDSDRPGAIRLAVDAPAPQLLVVAESFHPGWVFEIDGEPAPVLRVYGDFMGTVISRGAHEVALQFRPHSLTMGLWLSASGLLLLAVGVIFVFRAEPSPQSTSVGDS